MKKKEMENLVDKITCDLVASISSLASTGRPSSPGTRVAVAQSRARLAKFIKYLLKAQKRSKKK